MASHHSASPDRVPRPGPGPDIPPDKGPGFETYHIVIVTRPDQLPVDFLQPSAANKLVIGFDCEGVNLCRNGALCIMQLAFPHVAYLIDAIEGGEELIQACKPALESDHITKVIHDCKRDSEALYCQFGIKLHNVMDTQIACSLIEEQEGQTMTYDDRISFVSGIPYDDKQEVRTLLRQDPNFWKSRPLTEMMVGQAVNDVCFLLKIHEKMMERLSKESLWRLAVRSELYCRCFCLNDNQFVDWPPLPPVPDDIEVDAYVPEVEHAAAEWGRLRRTARREKVFEEYSLLCTDSRTARREKVFEEYSLLCTDSQADRRYLARACILLTSDLCTARARYLRAAEWSFAAGQYEDSADAMNSLALLGFNLTSIERGLFEYCNLTVIQSLQNDPCLMDNNCDSKIGIQQQIQKRSKLIITIIDMYLLPFCLDEDIITFNIIKGYHWAALAETKDERQSECIEALASYMEAVSIADKTLNPLDPLRLRATVHLVSFLDEAMGLYDRAYEIARKAIANAEDAWRSGKNDHSTTVNATLDLLNKRMQRIFYKITGDKDLLPYPFHFDRRWAQKEGEKTQGTRSFSHDDLVSAHDDLGSVYRYDIRDKEEDLQLNERKVGLGK